jgi:hypothetical protein
MSDILLAILIDLKNEYGLSSMVIFLIFLCIWGGQAIFRYRRKRGNFSQQKITAGNKSTNIQVNGSNIDV